MNADDILTVAKAMRQAASNIQCDVNALLRDARMLQHTLDCVMLASILTDGINQRSVFLEACGCTYA
jgi:hypothetical protein